MQCTSMIRMSDGCGGYKMFPCGQCMACRLNRARDWALRLMHENKMHDKSCFVTLTYNQESAPWVSDFRTTLVKADVQGFMKRLRDRVKPVKVRFFLCGEYGEKKGRAHYHLLLFGVDESYRKDMEESWTKIVEDPDTHEKKRVSLGFVHIGNITFDSANYVARYCTKALTGKKKVWYKERNLEPEFSLMSRRPGIGAEWLKKYGHEVKQHHNVVAKGKLMPPPRYYRDKVYDESDRDIVRGAVIDRINERYRQEALASSVYERTGNWYCICEDQDKTRDATLKARLKKRGM